MDLGNQFREARERRGETLIRVADLLRIKESYLKSIEDDRFEDLPGKPYIIGFLKTYAVHLGLDVRMVLDRYRALSQGDVDVGIAPPAPATEGQSPTSLIITFSILCTLGIFGVWYHLTTQNTYLTVGVKTPFPVNPPPNRSDTAINILPEATVEVNKVSNVQIEKPKFPMENQSRGRLEQELQSKNKKRLGNLSDNKKLVRDNEDSLAETVSGPKKVQDQDKMPSLVEEKPPQIEILKSEESREGGQSVENKSLEYLRPRARTVVPPEIMGDSPSISGPSTIGARKGSKNVSLRAKAASWIELRRANGGRLISKMLQKGEIYNVPQETGVSLSTGNAGVIEIMIDGEVLGTIGSKGAVRRDILLDPENLMGRLKKSWIGR
jgi:cytoskeleton protein RodZ